ncbi:hypothetical protein [Streptomyces sp. KL116D]|uniref:hypothetical protein n=1 Tax=Streptomyces sp. KL116D TaxID=3045152 RepID=UPI003558C9D7
MEGLDTGAHRCAPVPCDEGADHRRHDHHRRDHPPPGAPFGRTEADAHARAARLEALLGDPYDPANPHGLAALFAADDRGEPPAATETLLAGAGFGAELVPAAHGGLLTRADLLARALRPRLPARRRPRLRLRDHLLFAAGAVWTAGTARQRQDVADPAAQRRPGDDPAPRTRPRQRDPAPRVQRPPHRGRLPARRPQGRHHQRGPRRPPGRLRPAPTRPAGPRSHSVLLLDPDRAGTGHVQRLPRVALPGMRGALFSGLGSPTAPSPPRRWSAPKETQWASPCGCSRSTGA